MIADADAPNQRSLSEFLDRSGGGRSYCQTVLVLDRVHNPANVGMILRSAVAAGIDGVVIPRAGTARVGPVAIKASAGVAFHAPIVNCETTIEAIDALRVERFTVVGLDASGDEDLFDMAMPERVALVVGNETDGLSPTVREQLDACVRLPLAAPVESLNVACLATVVSFELARRQTS